MILNPWWSCISLPNDGITVGFQKALLKTTSEEDVFVLSLLTMVKEFYMTTCIYSRFSRHIHTLLPCNRWSHCKILHWHGKRFLYYPNHSDSQKENSILDYFSTTEKFPHLLLYWMFRPENDLWCLSHIFYIFLLLIYPSIDINLWTNSESRCQLFHHATRLGGTHFRSILFLTLPLLLFPICNLFLSFPIILF